MIDNKTEPAFPQNPETMRWALEQGMSLRDYFAAKAMHLLLAQQDFPDGFDYGQKATWAYKMADAMLEARK